MKCAARAIINKCERRYFNIVAELRNVAYNFSMLVVTIVVDGSQWARARAKG